MKKVTTLKAKESNIPLSFRNNTDKKILFRLFNPKRSKSKSFARYESARFSTTIKSAFDNSYQKIDFEYDTTNNDRFKSVNLLSEFSLSPKKKALYQDLLASNQEYISKNKVSEDIKSNQKFFSDLVSKL
jgi:hypothetical protein